MNAPPKVIFPTYDDDSFKTIPLPPVHNITCDQYESTDAIDTGDESDADDETIDNDKDDEDMDPSWKLSDAEQFLSDDEWHGSGTIERCISRFPSSQGKKNSGLWFMS